MIVVDSAVWIDFFNGAPTAEEARLTRALTAEEPIAICRIILTEVLQGFRSLRAFENARRLLVYVPMLELDTAGHVEAARLFQSLRHRGLTVRGTIDCIVAQLCIAAGAELLARDRDFTSIAKYSLLRLCRVAGANP